MQLRLRPLLTHLLTFALFSMMVGALSGCATGMSGIECAAESMNPTVMASLDSFESAAIAIKLSNRVLLHAPLSEQDTWPNDLYGVPSGVTLFKMGLSAFASSQGITLATEIDPATGWPRPTSALYLFLKEREALLNKDINKDDLAFFKEQTRDIYYRELGGRKLPTTINDYVYRNPLMAYGVVTNNRNEMLQMEEEINLTAEGYTRCDAFLRKASEDTPQEVKKAACKDPTLKDEAITAALKEKNADMATMEKNYGKLANKVYSASLAGADFTMAAMVKIGCAVVNGVRALPNIKTEFSKVKGIYNAAMIFPRIRMVLSSLKIYKDNLGLQYTVYRTMYQQIKGTYQIKEEPAQEQKTAAALYRIGVAQRLLGRLEPKLALAFAGEPVSFSSQEARQLHQVAALFDPDSTATVLMAQNGLP